MVSCTDIFSRDSISGAIITVTLDNVEMNRVVEAKLPPTLCIMCRWILTCPNNLRFKSLLFPLSEICVILLTLRIELNESICKGGNSSKRINIPYKKLISNA